MNDPAVLVALLGSSNLTVGLPHALCDLLTRFPRRELTILVAYGPGRSYEVDRGSLGVKFRALSRCALLPAFEQARRDNPSSEAFALLTDIGNDLMHGISAETLASRVREVVGRLGAAGASVAVTALPVEGISALSPGMFHLARTAIFPTSRTRHEEVVRGVRALQDELRAMDERGEIQLLPARSRWYSPDACHLRPALSAEAMRDWLDGLTGFGGPEPIQTGGRLLKEALYLHSRPEFRFLRRNEQSHEARPFEIAPGVTVRGF